MPVTWSGAKFAALVVGLIIGATSVFSLASFVLGQEEKPIIAFDQHHGSSVSTVNMRKIADAKGWMVIDLKVEPITLKVLMERRIVLYVISGMRLAYTDQEIEELKAYVENGGNIVVIVGPKWDDRQYARELTRKFGIDILEDHLSRELSFSVSSTHPLLKDVGTLFIWSDFSLVSYYLAVAPPAYDVLKVGITEPYRPLIAAYESRSGGKVIVFPWGLDNLGADNAIFIANILRWVYPPEIKPPTLPILTQTVTVTQSPTAVTTTKTVTAMLVTTIVTTILQPTQIITATREISITEPIVLGMALMLAVLMLAVAALALKKR